MQLPNKKPTVILEDSLLFNLKENAEKGDNLDYEAFKELALHVQFVIVQSTNTNDAVPKHRNLPPDIDYRVLVGDISSETYELGALVKTIGSELTTTFILRPGLTLSFYCKLIANDTGIQTLFFHTIKDVSQWIFSNPMPSVSLNQAIDEGANLLSTGKLVAFPTETVYGLGADATDIEAVRSIFKAKQRPFFDPLIVHIANFSKLKEVVADVSDQAKALMEKFWPGPLTLVFPKKDTIPLIVTGNSETVAVRMPSNPIARALIERSKTCIAGPSANRFGYTSPTTAEHVCTQLGVRIDAIIDGGACPVGIESTVLSLVGDVPTLLRPGQISIEEISEVIGLVIYAKKEGPIDTPLESSGLLESHYAPNTELRLVKDVQAFADRKDVGIILFEETTIPYKGPVEYISRSKNPLEAASKLYWAIRKLDERNISFMVVSLLEEKGIGAAINNRLKKAAAKR